VSAGAVTLDDIQSADWSLMLDSSLNSFQPSVISGQPEPGSGIGNVVQGVDDVNQCIGIILGTPKGSDPLRPTFACDLWQWIDAPVNVARPHLVREIVEAITKWEPRVRVLSVVIGLVGLSQLSIAITWQLKVDVSGAGSQKLVLTVPRNLG
jgi:phage baseplate assembly protein W